jgi:hypothetical protein
LEAINIHRTPLNCYTLLRVLEKNINHYLFNHTKLIKDVLLSLFNEPETLLYNNITPDVDDVEFILGKFCSNLVINKNTKFDKNDFKKEITEFCKSEYLKIDIYIVIKTLLDNKILIERNNFFEFKHSYWIFYFAATYMLKDSNFKSYVLDNKNYINFPEIIDFYSGIDGRRDDIVSIVLENNISLIKEVEDKIGISNHFNPYKNVIWNPSEESIESLHQEVKNKVSSSKLPNELIDSLADKTYNSENPYNQSVNRIFNEYKVLSLIQSLKASSRVIRNSKYIPPELKVEMFNSIIEGWEQISKVIFWMSPMLAIKGRFNFEGFGLFLDDNFVGTLNEKFKQIYLANPKNVINFLKDDISSKKIGPLFEKVLNDRRSDLQSHLVCLFLIKEKPTGWVDILFDYMNLLHPNSFYLGDITREIENELKNCFNTDEDCFGLKKLGQLIMAKHKYSSKRHKNENLKNVISENNKLQIDKILSQNDNSYFKKQKCSE